MAHHVITDAEALDAYDIMQKYPTIAEAARATGIPENTIRRRAATAAQRNLIRNKLSAEDKLRIELAATKRDLRALEREHDSAEKIRTEIFNLAARTPEPPAWITPEKPPLGTRGTPMTLWSDWHYGEVVRSEEVGGVNAFNAEIAGDRIRQLVNATVDLCKNHMGRAKTTYPGIVVCLGGDMITGEIHEELTETNDRTTQQCIHELTDLIAAGLGHLADEFSNVFVPCVVGNHGRSTRKPRMKGMVFSSYEWLIYAQLERHFRNDKRVRFFIPGEADAHFRVYGHRFLLTHGDRMGVKGGDGIIGAIGPILRGAMKVGRSEAQMGRDFDTLLIGHWHQWTNYRNKIIVNGALKGFDEFAHLALRAEYERPIQALWFVHPQHGITASWPIYLDKGRTVEDAGEWIGWRTEP